MAKWSFPFWKEPKVISIAEESDDKKVNVKHMKQQILVFLSNIFVFLIGTTALLMTEYLITVLFPFAALSYLPLIAILGELEMCKRLCLPNRKGHKIALFPLGIIAIATLLIVYITFHQNIWQLLIGSIISIGIGGESCYFAFHKTEQ